MIIDTTDCVVQNNCSPRREIWISIATMLSSLKCAITVVALRFIHTAEFGNLSPYQIIPIIRARTSDFSARINWVQTRLPLIVCRKSGESLSVRVRDISSSIRYDAGP
jgi:hypothetical protein